MPARKHSLSTFTVCSLKECILAILIYEEDSNMIETKTFTDEACDRWKDLVKVIDQRDGLSQLSDCLQLCSPAYRLLVCCCQFCCSFFNTLFEVYLDIFKLASDM